MSDDFVARCKATGDMTCTLSATQKKLRDTKFLKGSVYPWKNNDFNYRNYVDNKYSPVLNRISNKTDIKTTFNNIDILVTELAPALVDAAMPNDSSKAAVAGVNSDLIKCKTNNASSACNIKRDIQKSYSKQTIPYPDFTKDVNAYNPNLLKLNGRNSSSYFLKVGTCPVTKYTDKISCEGAGYKWGGNFISGTCNKPKLAFVDNSPGYLGLDGMIPTLGKDILQFTPDKIITVLMGGDVPGFSIMPCSPAIPSEGFCDSCTDNSSDNSSNSTNKDTNSTNNKEPRIYHTCNISNIVILIILFVMIFIINKLF